MRIPKLSALLTVIALSSAPLVASAAPDRTEVTTTVATKAQPAADAQRYAAREAQSPKAADFQGGAEGVVIIGTSTIVLAVLIALIVIML